MNFCPKCGEHLFKGTSYCLACHAPVRPPQRVQPLNPEDDEETRIASDDYRTHVSPEPPRPNTAPLPPPPQTATPGHSAPLPQQPSAPLPQPYREPPRRDWTVYFLAAACGVLVAFLILALAGVMFGVFTLYNPFGSEETARQQSPAPQQLPTPAQQETPQPAPTRTPRQRPTPAPAQVPDANIYSPGYNANVYTGGNANYYPPATAPRSPVVIVNGSAQVNAGAYRYNIFTVPAGSTGIISGNISAQGGRNDIDLAVIPAAQVGGFASGNYNSFLQTGYTTGGPFRVTLPPGSYALVYSNTRALLTPKIVRVYAQLQLQ